MRNKNDKTGENLQKNIINSSFNNPYFNTYTEEVIISLKKVRKLGMKSFSLSGNISSIKRNSLVSFESSLERDYINILEFDTQVNEYLEQPLKIYYEINNKRRYYVPDFYIKYLDERPDEIVEIKYSYALKKNKNKLKDKFKAAELFCKGNGINFKIVTEKEIRNDLLLNSKFLLSYKNPKSEIDFNDVDLIEGLIKSLKNPTPQKTINSIDTDIEHKAQLLYVLWYMISNDLVKTELSIKLTMNSKIWL